MNDENKPLKPARPRVCCAAMDRAITADTVFFFQGDWKVAEPGAFVLKGMKWCPFCGWRLPKKPNFSQ